MQPRSLELEFFRNEKHVCRYTQSRQCSIPVYWLVHGKIFDQEHAHVRARTNRQRDRITCNPSRRIRERIHIFIHIPVAFSLLLQSRCWSYDARYNSKNYSCPSVRIRRRLRNTNSPFFARTLLARRFCCLYSDEERCFLRNTWQRTCTNNRTLTDLPWKASLENHSKVQG